MIPQRFCEYSRKYDSSTRVKFPLNFLPDTEGSNTFVDVRIGCCICSRGRASTLDVRPSKDYTSTFTPLSEIDFRMPYYNSNSSLAEMDSGYAESSHLESWYLWQNPQLDYVLSLRNMLRTLSQKGINTWYSGVGMLPDDSTLFPIANYYGSADIPGYDKDDDSLYNFIDSDEITLCPGCYLWSSFVYPETVEHFKHYNQFELGYKQWLEQYEDKLIVES